MKSRAFKSKRTTLKTNESITVKSYDDGEKFRSELTALFWWYCALNKLLNVKLRAFKSKRTTLKMNESITVESYYHGKKFRSELGPL